MERLRQALEKYREICPDEAATVAIFAALITNVGGNDSPFRREHQPGHFTGSAFLVSADGERVLLTHHRKLDLWLQPGGHADGDVDLARVALREAEEETGVAGLRLEDGEIFDLDRHRIPARRAEPEHWHYDVRYVVRAGNDERFEVSEESHDLAWREIAQLAQDDGADVSLRRMAQKWLARHAGSSAAQRTNPG